jgi:hypothetical protein
MTAINFKIINISENSNMSKSESQSIVMWGTTDGVCIGE